MAGFFSAEAGGIPLDILHVLFFFAMEAGRRPREADILFWRAMEIGEAARKNGGHKCANESSGVIKGDTTVAILFRCAHHVVLSEGCVGRPDDGAKLFFVKKR